MDSRAYVAYCLHMLYGPHHWHGMGTTFTYPGLQGLYNPDGKARSALTPSDLPVLQTCFISIHKALMETWPRTEA